MKKEGRHGTRSKNGCLTCRIRHVKCDEEKPSCGGCRRMQFGCDWPTPGCSVVLAELRGNSSNSRGDKSNHHQGGKGSKSCTATGTTITTTSPTPPKPLKSAARLDGTIAAAVPSSSHRDRRCPDDGAQVPVATVSSSYSQQKQPQIGTSSTTLAVETRPKPVHRPHHHQHAILSSPNNNLHNININIPCRNSIILSRHDRMLLDHFPSSTIFCIHSVTTRQWSPLQYVYEVTAGSSSMVMHMILAYSASELRRKRHSSSSSSSTTTTFHSPSHSSDSSCSGDMEVELYHYTAALRELQACITTGTGAETEVAWARFEKNFDAILATIFFMIHFGLQCMASLDHARTHVAGLASLVVTYARVCNKRRRRGGRKGMAVAAAGGDEHHGFSPLSSLLILWILYVDIIGHSYGLSQDLVSLFGNKVRPLLNLGQLFRDARFGFPALLWGGDRSRADWYGENSRILRGLAMAHEVYLLRSRIWKAREEADNNNAMDDYDGAGEEARARPRTHNHYEMLTGELLALQKKYADIFSTIPSTPPMDIMSIYNTTTKTTSVTNPPIPTQTLCSDHAAEMNTKLMAHYWACILFCRRWLQHTTHLPPPHSSKPEPPTEPLHRNAISQLIDCLPAFETTTTNDNDVDSNLLRHNPNRDQATNRQRRKEMLIRFAWPTFMAAIETRDVSQRYRLLDRLREVRDASAECEWCWDTAREIVGIQQQQQSSSSSSLSSSEQEDKECWVDLADYMQKSSSTGCFSSVNTIPR